MKGSIKNVLKMYKDLPVQVKASIWFVAGTVLLKGISFITVPIFTRLMTVEQYGIYSVYLTWCEIVTIIGTLSLESCALPSVLTKFKEKEKYDAQCSLLGLSFVITSGLMVLVVIFGNSLSSVIGLPRDILLLMVLQIYFMPSVNFWTVGKRFEYKYISLVFVSVSMAILNAVIGILFVINLSAENQAYGRVISIVLVQVCYGIFLFYKLKTRRKFCFTTKYWKWALKLHIPLLPHTLSLKVLSGADRIMINAIIGSSAAALYSVSYSVAVVVNLIKTSSVDAIRPWIYQKLERKDTDNIKEVVNGILVLVSLLTLAFIAFAPEIIYICAPSNYYEAIYCMPPVMISSFFTFLYSIFSIVEMYYEEAKKIMLASVSAALLNIVLNYIFISKLGYIAAAFTTLVCYIFLALAHYIMMHSILKKNHITLKLFDAKTILLVSTVLIALMFAFELLCSMTVLRYCFLALIAFIIILRRKYFMGLFKIIRK